MGKRGCCDVEVHNASKSLALSRILAGEFEQIFNSRIAHGTPVINWCCHCRQSNVQLRAAAGWPPGSLVTRFAAVSVEGSWLRAFLHGGARMSENPFSGHRRLLHTHLACVILFV